MKKLHALFFAIISLPSIGIALPYFQQKVSYTIHVKLDDVKNEITADERIEYTNNSPNQLTFIYMHLWANAYKNNSTPLVKQLLANNDTKLYYAKEDERGYIDQLDFKIDGQPVKWELLKDSIDICKIYLNEPLPSGKQITITTPFHVKIPSGRFSRLGHIGQSYQITQWYPKPAVYDRNGWNYMPYLNQGEFYSEFGDFDVSITVPKNYVLAATGDMVDGEKETEWLTQKAKETQAITSYNSSDLDFPASDSVTKTLRFKQSNVHDFAWFCDKRYHVLKSEIETPHTKHKVTTWLMFTNTQASLWKNSIPYINDAIYYYSLWNGDYPYNNCTAVDGTISAGGGMEYPNVTVIGNASSAFQLDVVITHEVGHNWFYGMLGSNERVHPWMDEGINSYNELRYVETKYPSKKLVGTLAYNRIGKAFDLVRYKQKSQYELLYQLPASKNEDQPIETPAYNCTELNYGGIIYSKTAIVFDYLKAYLGEEEMDKAMQRYFDEWHYKHPMPEDFRKVMEQSTGKDLSWFFDGMIDSNKKLDYKILSSTKKADGTWDIEVENKSGIKGPLFIQSVKNGKMESEMTYDGFDGKKTLTFPSTDVDHFKIDYLEEMPEINRDNNTIRIKGAFKKVEPLKLQFLGSIDNPDKSQLFFTPVAGWNNYNKWMFGLAFYNNILPEKKLEFQLMPMYSFGTKALAGYGKAAYHIFPNNNLFQNILIGVTGTRYAYSNHPFDMNFNKIAPELTFEFKKNYPRSPYKNTLSIRNISIIQDTYAAEPASLAYSHVTSHLNFNNLTYTLSKKDAINPFSIVADVQQGEKMMKTSLTANYTRKFKKKDKGIDVRFFAGTFIGTNVADAMPYRFRLSGQNGSQDYLYDNIFLGRTETSGILANQFTETDGGFKFYSTIGQTSQWITSLNIKSSLGNLKVPLKLYADLGTTADDGLNKQKILYNSGVCLSLSKNILEIYFPLLISQDFQDYTKANHLKYMETVRFTLNFNLLNPFDLVKSF